MNHLKDAKDALKADIEIETATRAGMSITEYGLLNALIAMVEEAKIANAFRAIHEASLVKIAEQLERMNDQELRIEELDFCKIVRKVDK